MFFNHFAGFDRSLRPKPSGNLLRLLFVGNDFARKGGHDLVAVFSQHLVGRCELDVVSNDALNLPKLPGLRNRRGLNHESSEWLALFEDADVFVMPTHEDCLPMAYIEAATAGLPIVGTSVMSVPEVVRDGVNGLAVTSGDRAALAQVVARLLGDPALRKRFGESSRRLVESEFHPIINHGPLTKIFRESAVASQIEAAKLSHTSKRALSQ
jgi:glycosyltransferase involved in cell wall biosynthesis